MLWDLFKYIFIWLIINLFFLSWALYKFYIYKFKILNKIFYLDNMYLIKDWEINDKTFYLFTWVAKCQE